MEPQEFTSRETLINHLLNFSYKQEEVQLILKRETSEGSSKHKFYGKWNQLLSEVLSFISSYFPKEEVKWTLKIIDNDTLKELGIDDL